MLMDQNNWTLATSQHITRAPDLAEESSVCEGEECRSDSDCDESFAALD